GSRFGKINSTWPEFSFGLKGLTKLYPVYVKGKKKANPIVIPSIRFTKLIIHHLQSKHKFHPRPDSPLHFPYEEYILGYLKFSAKGTKREVFGMPISNELITAGIRRSDPDSPAPKPAKVTKKSKPSAPKAGPVTKPVAAQQPKPKPTPAKTQEKKYEFVDEGISEKQPRGPLPPMVFREPDSGKFQPLPEVQGKGKEKRRTPAPNKPSGHAKSPSIYAEPSLIDSDTESDEEVSPVVVIGAQDKGQAGPNSGVQIEGHAGSNPGDDAEPQPQSSHVVHVGPNLKHMDLEAADVSTQQHPEKMDEGFNTTAYPIVQENLKLPVEEQVILEEPASFTGTLSSLQHLANDFSFGDQFFNDKPFEAENKKTTAETKAESMVSVGIHQDTSAIPLMTSPVIDLISRPDFPNDHRPLPTTITMTITTLPLPPQPQQGTTDFIFIKRIDMKEILHQRMWETNSYKDHEDHMMLYEALEKSMNRVHTDELLTDLAEARRKKKKRHDSPKIPPGSPPQQPPLPPPLAGPSRTLVSPEASGSSQLPLTPPPPSTSQSDQSKSTATLSSSKTFCKKQRITKLKSQDLEGLAFELVKVFHPNVVHLQYQMKECHKILTGSVDELIIRDLEYLRYGSKGGRHALSVLKMKATYYLDVGLEKMVPDKMWIEKECKYDIAAMYGISHWWFQRKRFYIDRHTYKGDRRAVRTHMRILSVVRIKVFSMYGYDYMKKIVLRTTNLNEHIIVEKDLKYLYPSDFDDLDQMIIRFNEIHKFSDGTLHQIDEALEYQVKEFKVNRMNPGLNIRDLPKDNPLVRVEVFRKDYKKEKSKNKGRVPTEMNLELQQTQQGSSYEVS
nr:hypothetical protein [Tanacetum cinerariifolium]